MLHLAFRCAMSFLFLTSPLYAIDREFASVTAGIKVREFAIRYLHADEVGSLIKSLDKSALVLSDERDNTLIVKASQLQLDLVSRILSAYDVRNYMGNDSIDLRIYSPTVLSFEQIQKRFSSSVLRELDLFESSVLGTPSKPVIILIGKKTELDRVIKSIRFLEKHS